MRLQDLQIFKIYKENKGFEPPKAPKVSSPENQVLGPEKNHYENRPVWRSRTPGSPAKASRGPFGWGRAVRRTDPNIANMRGK